jgi:hypothetical protein
MRDPAAVERRARKEPLSATFAHPNHASKSGNFEIARSKRFGSVFSISGAISHIHLSLSGGFNEAAKGAEK